MNNLKLELSKKDIKRFWSKVDKTGICWNWTGATTKGYGAFRLQRKTPQAHRISYTLVKGRIPDGLVLDHLCDNPRCVRPSHLEAVTNRENVSRGHRASKTGTTGVRYKAGKYEVQKSFFNNNLYLGRYETLEEAIIVYQTATLI